MLRFGERSDSGAREASVHSCANTARHGTASTRDTSSRRSVDAVAAAVVVVITSADDLVAALAVTAPAAATVTVVTAAAAGAAAEAAGRGVHHETKRHEDGLANANGQERSGGGPVLRLEVYRDETARCTDKVKHGQTNAKPRGILLPTDLDILRDESRNKHDSWEVSSNDLRNKVGTLAALVGECVHFLQEHPETRSKRQEQHHQQRGFGNAALGR